MNNTTKFLTVCFFIIISNVNSTELILRDTNMINFNEQGTPIIHSHKNMSEEELKNYKQNKIYVNVELTPIQAIIFNNNNINKILADNNFPKVDNYIRGISIKGGVTFTELPISLLFGYNRNQSSTESNDKISYYTQNIVDIEFRYNITYNKWKFYPSLSLIDTYGEIKVLGSIKETNKTSFKDTENRYLDGVNNVYMGLGLGGDYKLLDIDSFNFFIGFKYNFIINLRKQVRPALGNYFMSDLSKSSIIGISLKMDVKL